MREREREREKELGSRAEEMKVSKAEGVHSFSANTAAICC